MKKISVMFKAILALIMLALLSTNTIEPIYAGNLEILKKIEPARNQIVEILVGFKDGDNKYHVLKNVCGAIVENNKEAYIISLYEKTKVSDEEISTFCKDEGITKSKKVKIILYAVISGETKEVLEVIDYNEQLNIALLKGSKMLEGKSEAIFYDVDELAPNEDIYSVGYPSGLINQDASEFDINDSIVYKGIISQKYDSNTDKNMKYKGLVNSGNLGGIIVDKNGYCIALNTAGSQGNEVADYSVTPIKQVLPILDKNKITYKDKAGTSIDNKHYEKEKKSNRKIYIGIKIAILPITIILIVVLLIVKRCVS